MKTLSIHLIALALLCGTATTLHAQAAAPAPQPAQPAPSAAPPAAAQPEVAPAAQPAAAQPEQAPAATAPAPAATEAAPSGAAPEAAPKPEAGAPTEDERQLREADRARIRLLLARARAERAALDDQQAAQEAERPAPQPERARHGDAGAPVAVGLSMELPWHTEPAFDLFSENDVSQRYGLWATYDVLALGESAFVAAGAGFDVEQADAENLFASSLDTELSAVVLYGTAVLRYVPLSWLQPHARLSVGGQFVRSRLAFGDVTYQNDGDLPFGSLGAGFTLRTPTRTFESRRGDLAALSFGIMVEGGYALVSTLEMKVDGNGPDDRDISLIESDLEDLDRSGPFLRMSLVARF